MLSCLTLVYICKIVNKNALIYLEEDNVLLNDSFNHLSRKSFVENHFPAFCCRITVFFDCKLQ